MDIQIGEEVGLTLFFVALIIAGSIVTVRGCERVTFENVRRMETNVELWKAGLQQCPVAGGDNRAWMKECPK